ncbi:uncharacterized protein LOC129883992 [Solanum dulcamara]|uniref:uncharacterized protein LOC129883992 n=1 Tax=Solanum dulcamara TaxID=45834 RepID=UPI002484E1AF|nr:uncharacterized protein LOC129883992 [Solanum dulcamara]
MWGMTIDCIRKAATEVLGASRGIFDARQGDWWWNGEVQGKVKAKKVAYTEWLEYVDEEEKSRLKDIYKKAKTEAKSAITSAKTTIFERLYVELGGKCGDKRLCFRVGELRCGISSMRRGRAIGLDEIPVDFWQSTDKAESGGDEGGREMSISKNQFGFMSGWSTIEAIHLMRGLVEKFRERKSDLHMVFNYLEKAYEKVPRYILLRCLDAKGVWMIYIRAIKDMYARAKSRVRTVGGDLEHFPVEMELHQGSVLSHFLFALMMDELTRSI